MDGWRAEGVSPLHAPLRAHDRYQSACHTITNHCHWYSAEEGGDYHFFIFLKLRNKSVQHLIHCRPHHCPGRLFGGNAHIVFWFKSTAFIIPPIYHMLAVLRWTASFHASFSPTSYSVPFFYRRSFVFMSPAYITIYHPLYLRLHINTYLCTHIHPHGRRAPWLMRKNGMEIRIKDIRTDGLYPIQRK